MDIRRLQETTHKYPMVRAALYPAIITKRQMMKRRSLLQRETLDSLAQILVDDPVVRIDEFEGVFSLSIDSGLLAKLIIEKHFEPELANLCLQHLDAQRDALDVGANVGFFTVLLAKHPTRGRVLAVEPTANALARLHRNLVLNDVDDQVLVFEGVASSNSGSVEIRTIEGREEFSTLGEASHPNTAGEPWVVEEVPSATLDELVAQHSLDPGFMKVDVEGAEASVLGGATTLLAENRPSDSLRTVRLPPKGQRFVSHGGRSTS